MDMATAAMLVVISARELAEDSVTGALAISARSSDDSESDQLRGDGG